MTPGDAAVINPPPFAGDPNVDERIVYHKLASLAEGARIATEKLWPQAGRGGPSRQAGV
jgi:hypothetical protein